GPAEPRSLPRRGDPPARVRRGRRRRARRGVRLLDAHARGGAAARRRRRPPEHGALDRIDAPYTTMSFGLAPTAEAGVDVLRDLDALYRVLAPWDAGARYLNFTESPVDARVLFPAESYERLCEVKARYDPEGLFRANHCLA